MTTRQFTQANLWNTEGINMAKMAIGMGSALLMAMLLVSCNRGVQAPTSAASVKETLTGLASFYGKEFHGEKTASGETFDMNEMVAAHPTYPTGTKARVTNTENAQSVEVRINDRGPAQEPQSEGVVIDLSKGAAAKIGLTEGRAKVKVEVIEWGE